MAECEIVLPSKIIRCNTRAFIKTNNGNASNFSTHLKKTQRQINAFEGCAVEEEIPTKSDSCYQDEGDFSRTSPQRHYTVEWTKFYIDKRDVYFIANRRSEYLQREVHQKCFFKKHLNPKAVKHRII